MTANYLSDSKAGSKPISGLKLMPPIVTIKEALMLYQLLAKIKSKIGRLNAELSHSLVNQSLIQLLTFHESVESTRIEGTHVTFSDFVKETGKPRKRKEVVEVENYKRALDLGIELIQAGNPISTRLIKQIHAVLMRAGTRGTTAANGEYRRIQNFIGPDDNIEHDVYVPVPAQAIADYMTNLEFYQNGRSHQSFSDAEVEEGEVLLDEKCDPLIKTAVLHAQFESIHPFLDGNGRVGRILIVLSTMSDELLNHPVFFVSEALEKERLRYYKYLNGVRGNKPDWYSWIRFFLEKSEEMADSLLVKLDKASRHYQRGLKTILKSAATTERTKALWSLSIRQPILTAEIVSAELNMTKKTANKHLQLLVELELLDAGYNPNNCRVFVNYDLIRAID
ncbi:Fic family protein [Fructobacillus sp. M2-14]|uniref:Fic family protein n=1 Tax=Fructobacillus broussonetiae TaxID=2713173 RepID=A0ABS5R0N6_9LACO|nr:Fic family protein [Fructobacillus broussonetiae]MBS9339010.1 Fic family protein [Fructobacillus broussonetiae]